MGAILGLGVTHGPFVLYPPETFDRFFRRSLAAPDLPPELRDPRRWPPAMQEEWGEDEGVASARVHHAALVEGFRQTRQVLDQFNPDVVVIWGDDQYENFHEDVVPAFCIYIEDEYHCQPFRQRPGESLPNVWGAEPDWTLNAAGHKAAAKDLATHLLNDNFDVAWAYKQLHAQFGHAFWRTVAHLDYDRCGFPYPVIPIHVNCYGRKFTGGRAGEDFDPPGPSPARCFALGASTARFFAASPYRAALIGSSSWSHAFLNEKSHFLWPDVEADRARFEELRVGNFQAWRDIPLSQIEDCGQHEMLNWICLAGAMDAIGRKPTHTQFVESWVSNSCKVFAYFEP